MQVSAAKDIYTELPPAYSHRIKLNSSTPFTPTYVYNTDLVSTQLYQSRIRGRQLFLENPARDSRSKKERAEKAAKRRSENSRSAAGLISIRNARQKGLWRLSATEAKFNLFLPLHSLWLGYMSELLALGPAPSALAASSSGHSMPSAASMHAKLVKADFHGSIVTVRQSKNPCLVGSSGIVVHETENTFKIVTKRDQLRLIPKRNSIFTFAVPLYASAAALSSDTNTTPTQVKTSTTPILSGQIKTVLELPHIEFELYGNQFCFRSAERAGKKFKHKETIEL